MCFLSHCVKIMYYIDWFSNIQIKQYIPGIKHTAVTMCEEGMAAHPSVLAWRTPWTEEAGGLEPMGSPPKKSKYVKLVLFLL